MFSLCTTTTTERGREADTGAPVIFKSRSHPSQTGVPPRKVKAQFRRKMCVRLRRRSARTSAGGGGPSPARASASERDLSSWGHIQHLLIDAKVRLFRNRAGTYIHLLLLFLPPIHVFGQRLSSNTQQHHLLRQRSITPRYTPWSANIGERTPATITQCRRHGLSQPTP